MCKWQRKAKGTHLYFRHLRDTRGILLLDAYCFKVKSNVEYKKKVVSRTVLCFCFFDFALLFVWFVGAP